MTRQEYFYCLIFHCKKGLTLIPDKALRWCISSLEFPIDKQFNEVIEMLRKH